MKQRYKTRYQLGRDFLREVVALKPTDRASLLDLQQRVGAFLAKGGSPEERMATRSAEIAELDAEILPLLRKMRVEQRMSLRRICDALTGMKIVSRYRSNWHPSTVSNILKRNGIE